MTTLKSSHRTLIYNNDNNAIIKLRKMQLSYNERQAYLLLKREALPCFRFFPQVRKSNNITYDLQLYTFSAITHRTAQKHNSPYITTSAQMSPTELLLNTKNGKLGLEPKPKFFYHLPYT